MPPERKVPGRSRALAADTCRTPHPATHAASTASDNQRAYGMPSNYRSRSRIDEGGRIDGAAGGAPTLCCDVRNLSDHWIAPTRNVLAMLSARLKVTTTALVLGEYLT
jgi:hypothetical protein